MAYTKLGRIRPVHKGNWSASTAYTALEMVRSGNLSYIANKDVPAGTPLSNGEYWAVVLDVSDVITDVYEAAGSANQAAANANNVMDVKANALAATVEGNPVQVHPDEGSLLKPVTELKPIQPGSGDPYPAGGGKNLLPFMVKGKTFSANGMTAEVKDEGLVVNGTPSGSYNNLVNYELSLPAGTYTISGGDASKGVIAQMNVTNADGSASFYINTTFEVKGTEQRIVVMIQNGGGTPTMTNYVLKAQLERGSTATEFALYENIRPITGRTGTELTRCGKNLLENTATSGTITNGMTYTVGQDGTISVTGTSVARSQLSVNPACKLPAGRYILSQGFTAEANKTGVMFARYKKTDGEMNYIDVFGHSEVAFTLEESTELEVIAEFRTSGITAENFSFYPMIRLASDTDATYEPYQGDTFALDFGQTVYGGTLDWNKGEMVVEWGYKALSSANMSSSMKYVPGYVGAWSGDIFDSYALTGYGKKTICNVLPDVAVYGQPKQGIYINSATSIGIQLKGEVFDNYTDTGNDAQNIDLVKAYLDANDVYFAYELATPITIQLTPQQITALAGANTLYTDGDGMTVDYNKDLTKAFEEVWIQLTAMQTALLNN